MESDFQVNIFWTRYRINLSALFSDQIKFSFFFCFLYLLLDLQLSSINKLFPQLYLFPGL